MEIAGIVLAVGAVLGVIWFIDWVGHTYREVRAYRRFFAHFCDQVVVDQQLTALAQECRIAWLALCHASDSIERKALSKKFAHARDTFEAAWMAAHERNFQTRYLWGNYLSEEEQKELNTAPKASR